jgi:hypothetical protein
VADDWGLRTETRLPELFGLRREKRGEHRAKIGKGGHVVRDRSIRLGFADGSLADRLKMDRDNNSIVEITRCL